MTSQTSLLYRPINKTRTGDPMHIKPSNIHKKEKLEKDKFTIEVTLPEHVTMKDVMLQYTDNSYRIKYAKGYEGARDGGRYACATSGCIEGTLPFKIEEPMSVAKEDGFMLVFKRGGAVANQLKSVRVSELCGGKKDKEICDTCGQSKKEDEEKKKGKPCPEKGGVCSEKGKPCSDKDEPCPCPEKGGVCSEKDKPCSDKDKPCPCPEKDKPCPGKDKPCSEKVCHDKKKNGQADSTSNGKKKSKGEHTTGDSTGSECNKERSRDEERRNGKRKE
ncbi:hypothetical protein THOM_0097 [Trachipleistophora hominis]|uniref:Uncharacterized protein n=1 Tax=Trachipleistophora hominis TaxID=72359 RepID=L7K0C7_TRAHO|nr:hypothetical protein THOM_0097 [Trachipleistophora hominis]